MKAMANKEFINSINYKKQQLRAVRTGAHPDILKWERNMVKACKGYSIPVFAVEMMRTSERQQELYDKGFSQAKAGESYHQYGAAVDIVHSTKLWDGMTKKEWRILYEIGHDVARKMNIKLENGFDWEFYDPAHWQLKDWDGQVFDRP